MTTWIITKALGGHLAGITVTDTLTTDPALGAPFTPGQQVAGFGCPYTVLACVRP